MGGHGPADGPTDDQVRVFVSGRYGPAAASSVEPAGAGDWSRAYAFTVEAGALSHVLADDGSRPVVADQPAPNAPMARPADAEAGGPAGVPEGRSVDLVIRFGRHGVDFAKDRAMGDLVRARGAGTVLPVPRVWELGDTPWGFFVTAQRCRGRYLDQLDGPDMRATLPDLLRTLDVIAALDPPGPGFGPWGPDGAAPFGSWRDVLLSIGQEQPRTAGWRQLLDGRPGPAAVFRRGLDALDRATDGMDAPRRFVHGDLLNRNVLVRPPAVARPGVQQPRGDQTAAPPSDFRAVTAVLDWGNSQYGDPVYDLSWLLFWWPWYPQWSGIDIRAAFEGHLTEAGRRPGDLDGRLLAYQLHIGLDHLAYNAFTRRWESLDRVADQLDQLLGRP